MTGRGRGLAHARTVAIAACLLVLLPSAASARVDVVGISDQNPRSFSSPLFRGLGITHVRLITPWDSIHEAPGEVDDWMEAVRAAGAKPLVAFNHSRNHECPDGPCVAPSPEAFEEAFLAFRARYPFVREYIPWNEANHASQPTMDRPDLAAAYYRIVERNCPGCTVVAVDVIDGRNMLEWLGGFLHHAGGRPRLWGLHNYSDVNRFRSTSTERFLALVPGEVWLTETGGIVSFQTRDGDEAFPYDEERAARAMEHLFNLVDAHSDRLRRLYVYHWQRNARANRFDAALVGDHGAPRPAFPVFQAGLERLRSAPLDGPTEEPALGADFAPQPLAGSALARRGRVPVALRCIAPEGCRGTLSVLHRSRVIGRGAFALGAAEATFPVRLNRLGRTRLARRRRLDAVLEIVPPRGSSRLVARHPLIVRAR